MNRKKNRNRTEPNRLQPDHRSRLPWFGVGQVAGCIDFKIFKNRLKTGCNRLQPVFAQYYITYTTQVNLCKVFEKYS
jgi:hypothetical protein